MCHIPKRLAHYCLAALTTAVAFGCDGVTDPGSITLALTSPSATVNQGASVDVATTLTRIGTFTGAVSITVRGTPPGVTAAVSNLQTSGAVTTATITITVQAATTPGTYSLTVRGAAAGVPESVATLALTVTEVPAYTLTPVAPALTIVQGTSAAIGVTIGRTNFTGGVTLSLEQPEDPALPAGIIATFDSNPATGASSVLTISVGSTVAAGTYNLLLRGAVAGLTGRIATLTLTVAEAPRYTLSASPAMLTLIEGGGAQTSTISISRTGGFTGSVALSVTSPVPGIGGGETTATLDPASTTGNSSTLSAITNAGPGSYTLAITGKATGLPDRIITILVTVLP